MIQIRDLEFRYGSEFTLRVPELSIQSGEKVAMVGPSGSGKTTLLMLFAGVTMPQRGSIRVADTQVDQLTDSARRSFRARRIGMVFQDFELIEYLSVEYNILLPFLINSSMRLTSEIRARVRSLAKATGLAEKLARYPRQLSQGEQQRVAICRAMITQPKLLLADEPTGSLDLSTANNVLDLLIEHVDQCGTTLLMVTHDRGLLAKFDRTINLADFHAPNAGSLKAIEKVV